MHKTMIFFAIGSVLVTLVSLIKLNQFRRKQNKKSKQKKKRNTNKQTSQQQKYIEQTQAAPIVPELVMNFGKQQKQLYGIQIKQSHPYKLVAAIPKFVHSIDSLCYKIVLNLNKGTYYQGIVKIYIKSTKQCFNKQDLSINFHGSILYVQINGKRLDQTQFKLKNHQIIIRKQFLQNTNQNYVQVIFCNKYSFLGEGLACYFPMRQNKRYSVKNQVIYTRNGSGKASYIFPCLNVLNKINLNLQILHLNELFVYSNGQKNGTKIVSKRDYPQYPFLFSSSNSVFNSPRKQSNYSLNNALNSPRKLNNSGTTDNSIFSYNENHKVKTQFHKINLNNIHQFFLFCSTMIQMKHSISTKISRQDTQSQSQINNDNIYRYFVKQQLRKQTATFINLIQPTLIQISRKIQKNNQKQIIKRINVFIIDDNQAQGQFATNSIYISQKSVYTSFISLKLYYLLCRALMGIYKTNTNNNSTNINNKDAQQYKLTECKYKLRLNDQVLMLFPQLCTYIYLLNYKYSKIRNQFIRCLQQNDIQHLNWIQRYYQQQCKYVVVNFKQQCINKSVRQIVNNMQQMPWEQSWKYMLSKLPSMQNQISQLVINIMINKYSIMNNNRNISHIGDVPAAVICSQQYLQLLPVRQIQQNIRTYLLLKPKNIYKILPIIKIKQSVLQHVPKKMCVYLNIKENRQECVRLYEQFLQFKEDSCCHSRQTLFKQIQRVRLFLFNNRSKAKNVKNVYYLNLNSSGTDKQGDKNKNKSAREKKIRDMSRSMTIRDRNNSSENEQIECGLAGWKLLAQLQIYPKSKQDKQLILKLQSIKSGADYAINSHVYEEKNMKKMQQDRQYSKQKDNNNKQQCYQYEMNNKKQLIIDRLMVNQQQQSMHQHKKNQQYRQAYQYEYEYQYEYDGKIENNNINNKDGVVVRNRDRSNTWQYLQQQAKKMQKLLQYEQNET